MDHSTHDMSMDMDMGNGHSGHGDMDMGPVCKMNMVFTWDATDMCVIFRWWHINNNLGLMFTILAIVALGMGYEFIRSYCRRYDHDLGFKHKQLLKSSLYALQVFYSFMLMLMFMTYNGWVMSAVVVGAFLGHLVWGGSEKTSRGLSCH
ncbi:Ctr-domain-containing protein [Nadsonia fulvescens var. elongata DSM 6958]|uniref:Copper transport protein n=1 Tax=Nadsonia fulvescens var. elongata DSM 6958 TaxID=857566 RepID=A0A1E3PSJ2_9ASCO|nr:Ctr-domain-containing protein [Nadsonia fulvescens var. elongata DSM 6958]